MRTAILSLLFGALLAGAAPGATDDEAAARKTLMALAGAFSNDGFKLRDGNWTGAIQPKASLLVQVHLYAGNQYWFSAGASRQAKKLSLSVFDETGALMKSEPYQEEAKGDDGPKAAAGFAPAVSGAYFVRIQETKGDAASFSFSYSYK